MPLPNKMTTEEYEVLNEYIAEQFGLHFPEHKREMLETRLSRRLETLGLGSYMEYYLALQYTPNGELSALARAITNNETYFFRETHQFEALFEHGLDLLRGTNPLGPTLHLLSAGCSSGEEACTLNFYAQENRFRMLGTQVIIDAFDLENEKIAIAKKGVYGASSMRCVEDDQLARYFERSSPGEFAPRPLYRSGIEFFTGNILNLLSFYRNPSYDAVFCRNVLIYFSEPAMRKAILNFAHVLRPGGLLFLGHSESIIGVTQAFEPIRLGNCIAYRRMPLD